MGCNCGSRKVDPLTGRSVPANTGGNGTGWDLHRPDGTVVHFTTKHAATVEKIRTGGGQVVATPAP